MAGTINLVEGSPMTRFRAALPVALMAALLALPVAAQEEKDPLPSETQEEDGLPSGTGETDGLPQGEETDGLPQDEETDGLPRDEETDGLPGGGGSDCICPKEGHWEMPNLEGWFKCKGAAMFNRKLKKHMKYGTTVMMNDDCTQMFGDGKRKKDEEGLMFRDDNCDWEGLILGAEQGVEVHFTVVLDVHTPEHITGLMAGDVSDRGFSCEVHRPFEMDWTGPLSEAERKRELKEGQAHAEWLEKQKKARN